MNHRVVRRSFSVIGTASILLVMLGLPTPSKSYAAGIWTHEPSGATVMLDCPFDSLSACNIQDTYSSGSIVTDDSAPVSRSNVLRSTIYARNRTGGVQLGYQMPSASREIYVGLIWRTNPEFQGRTVGNKMFFIGSELGMGVFLFGAPLSNGSGPLLYSHNSSLENTCGLACFPNVSSGIMTRGRWTNIEVYARASTSRTSRDGILRWWIDGVLVGNYTDYNFHGPYFNQWAWTETWDGSGDMGSSNTVDWSHYIDHLHISFPNCSTASCGNSQPVDNPIGPPAAPKVQTVTVTAP